MRKLRASGLSLIAIIALVLAVAAVLGFGIANSQSSGGRYDTDGDGLIEIEYLEQLDAVRYDLDGDGIADDADTMEYETVFPVVGSQAVCGDGCRGYELTRSLDFQDTGSYSGDEISIAWTANRGWRPLGSGGGIRHYYGGDNFNAVFEGNGYTISNLYIYRISGQSSVGLFGGIGRSGSVSGLGVIDADVSGQNGVGVLAGVSGGAVTGSYATGSVSGDSYIGGLVGINADEAGRHRDDQYPRIIGSYAEVSVRGNGELGGLAGENEGAISSSYATGDVFAAGNGSSAAHGSAGGLAGSNRGTIADSYATGDVFSDAERRVGGLAGVNGGTITASFATGTVLVDLVGLDRYWDLYAGGLTAKNRGAVIASYATGAVKVSVAGEAQGAFVVGGLIGGNGGKVIASYATGSISADVPGGVEHLYPGGLIGFNEEDGVVLFCFWDVQTSGQAMGIGEGGLAGVQGMSTAGLQMPTGYAGIYGNWNADLDNADADDNPTTGRDDFWDFGTSSQYPALRADFDGDGTATWEEFGPQGRPLPALPSTAMPTPPSSAQVTPTPGPMRTLTPTSTPGRFISLSGGGEHACGLLNDGAIACWGENGQGQASPPSGEFTGMVSGNSYTCGLRVDGTVICWGSISGVFPEGQ